uniref:Uncharacterized protein n=1 Tax=Anguilla anguilla TaxID=7936 RepID=A0A0E9UZS4_ANGAN
MNVLPACRTLNRSTVFKCVVLPIIQ